ncbi:hypothetical protein EJ03DRAFT_326559 [Teratosphaeria nubilosa]|uniref:Uncharacterized protein n=1 Tax=Teratosphaeria nubilosa TaxID=161662 RepID=A0A6G1LC66_9PEZI|nr:hypothetical protein EJ03DRAFT_326559 [Teratosphaeria nubilosa]
MHLLSSAGVWLPTHPRSRTGILDLLRMRVLAAPTHFTRAPSCGDTELNSNTSCYRRRLERCWARHSTGHQS